MERFALLILASLALEAGAQVSMPAPTGHEPIGTTQVPEGLREGYTERLDTRIAALPKDMDAAVCKDLTDHYRRGTKALLDGLNGDNFIFGHPINAYMDSILQAILGANPVVGTDVRLLVERSPAPNAYCMGEGTLVFTLGLLERLESEAQIAFVLCHELAHQHLDHVDKAMREHAARTHDKEFSREVRQALRQSYNRTVRLEELALSFTLDRRRHGRAHEREADSLGLVLLARTRFALSAGMATMDVLEACDREPFARPIGLRAAFETRGVVFKPEWDRDAKVSSLGNFERERTAIDDSLKTHPDCMARKAALHRQMDAMGGEAGARDPRGREQMEAVRTISSLELVDRAMAADNPCRALYLALRMLEKRPDDAFLHATVARAMATFHQHQKARRIGEILDRTNNRYSDSYNRTIAFVTDLRLSEYAEVGYQYMAAGREAGTEHGDMLFSLALTSLAMDRKEEARAAAERYRSLHPMGRHTAKLAGLLP